jgi:hypothetical protein
LAWYNRLSSSISRGIRAIFSRGPELPREDEPEPPRRPRPIMDRPLDRPRPWGDRPFDRPYDLPETPPSQPTAGEEPYFPGVEPEITIYGVNTFNLSTGEFIAVGTHTKQEWFEIMTSDSPDNIRAEHGGMGIPDIIRQLHALGYWDDEDREALNLELYGEVA